MSLTRRSFTLQDKQNELVQICTLINRYDPPMKILIGRLYAISHMFTPDELQFQGKLKINVWNDLKQRIDTFYLKHSSNFESFSRQKFFKYFYEMPDNIGSLQLKELVGIVCMNLRKYLGRFEQQDSSSSSSPGESLVPTKTKRSHLHSKRRKRAPPTQFKNNTEKELLKKYTEKNKNGFGRQQNKKAKSCVDRR